MNWMNSGDSWFSNTLESYVRDHKSALAATVRVAVPGIPATSDKLYLGTAAPNLKPGETRSLYRDTASHLSDRP